MKVIPLRFGGRHPARRSRGNSATLLISFLACCGFLLGILPPVSAQVSPGPLSKAHQSLSGPTRCTMCHRLGEGQASFRCLDCHLEISIRLRTKRGLHPVLVGAQNAEQSCAKCHAEHNGENFQLIRWDPTPGRFEHTRTGYVLEGKHAALECARCHNPEHIGEVDRQNIKMKDLRRSFLGLRRDCLACHADEHRGQLGKDCQRCHTAEGWKPAKGFDHAQTKFPLTGAHVQVACEKCHRPAEAGGPLRFTGLKFQACVACHNDPHRGAFAGTCESCHSTATWKRASWQGQFDHSKTKFPLLGKHVTVECAKCHRGVDFQQPLAHAKCADCHADVHGGQFLKRSDQGDCAGCHTVEGFQPTTFGLKEHATTAYPLEGKHAAVACAKCHVPAGKATLYKIRFAQCTDCHGDPHKGQFVAAPHFNRCEECHTLQGYRPSTFTIARHQKSRFPLVGAHLAVSCGECHRLAATPGPSAPVPYRLDDRSCTGCHTDPHRGQFRERMARPGPSGEPAGCETCHSTKTWRELSVFDHSTTRFPLTGAHRAVACIDCHRPPTMETTLRNVNFSAAPMDCAGCHADEHAGQFTVGGKTPACSDCHNTAKWRPSLFDHEKGTTFSLEGGHKDVPCRDCHKNVQTVQGKPVLFYKPTPRACAACHDNK